MDGSKLYTESLRCQVLPTRVAYVTNPYKSRLNAIPNLIPPFGPCGQPLVTSTQLVANTWVPFPAVLSSLPPFN